MRSFYYAFIVVLFLALDLSAQGSLYPSELKGYEFFGNGKLKTLRLTLSSKDDVANLFGEKCKKECDYDADWSIHFEYFEDIWSTERFNEKNVKLSYLLDTKYLGKLRLIQIRPKKSVSFVNITFSGTFQTLIETSTTDGRSDKSRMIVNDSFNDPSGLSYLIYSHTNYDDFKNKKSKSYSNGDLVLIRYQIPKAVEHDLFVLKQ